MNVYLYNGRYYYNPFYTEASIKPDDELNGSWAWKEVIQDKDGSWRVMSDEEKKEHARE